MPYKFYLNPLLWQPPNDGKCWRTGFSNFLQALQSPDTGPLDELIIYPHWQVHYGNDSLTINKFQRIRGATTLTEAKNNPIALFYQNLSFLDIYNGFEGNLNGNSAFILDNNGCVYENLGFVIDYPRNGYYGIEARAEAHFKNCLIFQICPFDGDHNISGGILTPAFPWFLITQPLMKIENSIIIIASSYFFGMPTQHPPSPLPAIKSFGNLIIDNCFIILTPNWQIQSAYHGDNGLNQSIIKNSIIAIMYDSSHESLYDWKWVEEDPRTPITFFNNIYLAYDVSSGISILSQDPLPYGALKPDTHKRLDISPELKSLFYILKELRHPKIVK